MPRPRQPISLIEAKGKAHMTKAQKEQRRKTEVTAASDKVRPPAYLPKEPKTLRRTFNKIAKELKAIGIITNLDVDALARYVIAVEMYQKVSKQLLNEPSVVTMADTLSLQDRLFKQCRSAAMDLGLTISSRCKLVMPAPKEQPKENKFAKFAKTAGK